MAIYPLGNDIIRHYLRSKDARLWGGGQRVYLKIYPFYLKVTIYCESYRFIQERAIMLKFKYNKWQVAIYLVLKFQSKTFTTTVGPRFSAPLPPI
eukprot:sb/3479263/